MVEGEGVREADAVGAELGVGGRVGREEGVAAEVREEAVEVVPPITTTASIPPSPPPPPLLVGVPPKTLGEAKGVGVETREFVT